MSDERPANDLDVRLDWPQREEQEPPPFFTVPDGRSSEDAAPQSMAVEPAVLTPDPRADPALQELLDTVLSATVAMGFGGLVAGVAATWWGRRR